MSKVKNVICMYHAGCLDGFVSSWVVRKWKNYVDAVLDEDRQFIPIPCKHGDPAPDFLMEDSIVFVVDFSFKKEVLERFISKNKAISVVVIDHHKTALEDLENVKDLETDGSDITFFHNEVTKVFDMNESGASLCLKTLSPNKDVPLINYVKDRDLWRFNLDDTKAITEALLSRDLTYKYLDSLVENWKSMYRDELISDGNAILKSKEKIVNEISKNHAIKTLWGYRVPVVNCPHQFASDVGNILGKGHPFAVCYSISNNDLVNISLRSDKDSSSSVDVGALAKLKGGGGHKHAAGLQLNLSIPIFGV